MYETTNETSNKNLKMALNYVYNGFPVFPIHYPTESGCSCGEVNCSCIGKHPYMTKSGFKDATMDEDQVKRWWTKDPNANIGIPTSKETFYVLDIDVAGGKQGEQSLAELISEHGELPECLTATTGSGGTHYCFRSDVELPGRTNMLPGIDFKGEGGYIVVEPSQHVAGQYKWHNFEDYDFIEDDFLPDWLAELVLNKESNKSKPDIRQIAAKPINEGVRNDTLFRLACSLRENNGADETLLYAALEGVNKTLPEPSDESELQKFVSFICQNYKPGNNDKNEAPECNLEKFLLDCYDVEYSRDPNSLLGHKLSKFAGIEEKLDGIQRGFYIMAAETNVGKTAFLSNLYFDLIETNPDICGVYFSMDDNKKDIRNKIISSRTKIPLTQLQKRQRDPDDERRKKEMNNHLIDLYRQGRMLLFDQSDLTYISQVRALADQLFFQSKPFFFAVDGLFNLNIGNYEYKREENIERANELKRIADIYEIPMICSAEVRKSVQKNRPTQSDNLKARRLTLDDIMETAKYVYNANVVWLLSEIENTNPDEISLELKYAKNKLEKFKQCQTLIYQPEYGNVYEEQQLSIMKGI